LISRHIVFGKDGFSRAFCYTQGTIYALIWVDGQEVWAFHKAINRANINAIGKFALNTIFGNDVSHVLFL
jgi:hypothetical protein